MNKVSSKFEVQETLLPAKLRLIRLSHPRASCTSLQFLHTLHSADRQGTRYSSGEICRASSTGPNIVALYQP